MQKSSLPTAFLKRFKFCIKFQTVTGKIPDKRTVLVYVLGCI